MSKEALYPADMPAAPAPYSPAVVSGTLVLISGQVPFDQNGELVSDRFEDQAHQVFENMKSCLAEAGCAFDDVLKVNAFLADFAHFDAYNSIYGEYFAPPYPARTTVRAGLYGFLIEVEAIARKP